MQNLNQIMSMLKNAQNPQGLLNLLAMQNPEIANAINMTNQICNGKDNNQLAIIAQNLAKEKGIDLNSIIKML